MARRRTLADAAIKALPTKPKPYAMPDPEMPGLYIRVRPTGAKVFCAVGRAPSGKQVWHTIGATTLYGIAEAREKAREAIKSIREGKSRNGPDTFATVADNWFSEKAAGLISAKNIRATLDRHLLPAWREREFATIRRGDVSALLREIKNSHTPVVRDFALTVIQRVCNWYATEHEDYTSPIVKGMRLTKGKEMARKRTLTDDEIRLVWSAAEANGTYGAFIRVALLTAQRREKLLTMRWQDIEGSEWCIPTEPREKSTPGCLILPDTAMEIINSQPRFASNPYVFAGRGAGHIAGHGKRKAKFDGKVKIAPWVIHDLRRTAKSLMARAGVRPDISERVLGHAITGVEGIYDRHSYRDEKKHALAALAGLIDTIVNPTPNVVAMRG